MQGPVRAWSSIFPIPLRYWPAFGCHIDVAPSGRCAVHHDEPRSKDRTDCPLLHAEPAVYAFD